MIKIYLSPPYINKNEKKNVLKALESNWIAPIGPFVDKFESKISLLTKRKYVLALNSGTSAIHLALKCLGVKKKDIVLCQSLTFAGSAFPILYEYCKPIFIDSELESWNIDHIQLEKSIKKLKKINKTPKAIIAVHLFGMPYNVEKISKISKKYKIPVIEDAAEALGSKYNNIPCGHFGNISIISFNGNKIATTGGGGALLTSNKTHYLKAKNFSNQSKSNLPYYLHKDIGYNYRLGNIPCAIGYSQLSNLKRILSNKNKIYKFYIQLFKNIKGINIKKLEYNKNIFCNKWLTIVIINKNEFPFKSKNYILNYLKTNNIEARPIWKPMHQQPIFKKSIFFNNNNSDLLYKSAIALPSGAGITKTELTFIKKVFNKLFKNKK
jgi:dTDP-4-amino-4,6-dideoxygalactose transaminase